MKTTDFLTELSNEKLAQYKTAASADASKADSEGDFKKGDKRYKGINTATKKQFDNDAKKVDEGVAVDPEQIQQIFKSAQEIQSAGGAANLVGGGNNRTAIGKVKDMFSKPNPVAAPGIKQSTSADPSVSAAEQPTTPAGQAAQAARQQRQAAATAALNKNTQLVGRPSDGTRTDTGDFSKFPRVQPKSPATATSALSAIAPKRVPAKPGEVNGLQMRNESFELSESQIYRLIGRIVKEHKKQVDEGITDWVKTKGQNLTTKITADKLLQAWNKAGKPTDSDKVADIMVKAGVPQETLTNLFTNFKLPAAKPVPAQPADPISAQPADSTASVNTPRPFTGSVNSYKNAGQSSFQPRASGGAASSTSNTAQQSQQTQQPQQSQQQQTEPNTPREQQAVTRTVRQQINDVMHTIMTQHNDDQPPLVKYLRQQLDSSFPPEVAATPTATPKATATKKSATKKPATKIKKPDNTIAMPKKGETIKWGGQEFKPGDPMYDKMKAAGGVKESAILQGLRG